MALLHACLLEVLLAIFFLDASATCQLYVNIFLGLVVPSVIFDTLCSNVGLTAQRLRITKILRTLSLQYAQETCLLLRVQSLIGRTLMRGTFWFGQATDVFLLEGLEHYSLFHRSSALFFFAYVIFPPVAFSLLSFVA